MSDKQTELQQAAHWVRLCRTLAAMHQDEASYNELKLALDAYEVAKVRAEQPTERGKK